MPSFVKPDSIVRRIWSDSDAVLLIFAGSAAEFALNRAVDWLYVTGELPRDPLGRLFSTAAYAQRIALGEEKDAERTMASIRAAHKGVERMRRAQIPDWAHRDVLYMLIDYSERAYERLHRPLTASEQEDLYEVFRRLGEGLGIPELPAGYAAWKVDREAHLQRDLTFSSHTEALYASYRRQLGAWRYELMLQVQAALAPEHVRRLLDLPQGTWPKLAMSLYRPFKRSMLRALVQRALIPPAHLEAVRQLDRRIG